MNRRSNHFTTGTCNSSNTLSKVHSSLFHNVKQHRRPSLAFTSLNAAPKEALSDIVIPGVFQFTDFDTNEEEGEEDPRIWVPQTDCLSFRPLCFCVSQGYYVNLLKFKGGGVLGKHRHSSPVHAFTLKGSWGYKEHEWNAKAGTYVFEPPGETHTLLVDEDCEEMITMFHVTGSLLYVAEDSDTEIIGFDDVFSKLEKAKKWYKECGLGEDYVQQFVR
jgi:quercetin dioxygenase-like cupin family protein